MRFEKEKFKQVLLYIVNKTGDISNVGKTVVYKILYFADFDFYEIFEKSITGEIYQKLPKGPAPIHFAEIARELKAEKKVREIRPYFHGCRQKKFIPLNDADTSLLSREELEIIDKTITKISDMNATEVSDYSHGDMPWKSADFKMPIDYEMVFYRNDEYSVREYS